MKRCKEAKRLQIYMDGWMDSSESSKFEKHLQKCSLCQTELMYLEEMSAAAMEIPDEAPEREYWEGFHTRVLNRIISRDISPYSEQISEPKRSRFKIGSYSLVIASLAVVMILLLNINFNTPTDQNALNNEQAPTPVNVVNATQPENIDDGNSANEITPVAQSDLVSVEELSNENNIEDSTIPAMADNSMANFVTIEEIPSQPPADNNLDNLFEDRFVANAVPVQLTERENNLENYPRIFEGRVNERYQLKPEIVADGILSLVDNTSESSRLMAFRNLGVNSSLSGNFISDRGGFNVNWGYLSMPGDISKADDYERYLIEIELIENK